MSADNKKPKNDKKPKPTALGWGMARKAGEALVNRKKLRDLAIKEAGG